MRRLRELPLLPKRFVGLALSAGQSGLRLADTLLRLRHTLLGFRPGLLNQASGLGFHRSDTGSGLLMRRLRILIGLLLDSLDVAMCLAHDPLNNLFSFGPILVNGRCRVRRMLCVLSQRHLGRHTRHHQILLVIIVVMLLLGCCWWRLRVRRHCDGHAGVPSVDLHLRRQSLWQRRRVRPLASRATTAWSFTTSRRPPCTSSQTARLTAHVGGRTLRAPARGGMTT